MKVGIITYHAVPNFGAQLQALSTVGYFRRNGIIPVVLHWYPEELEAMYRNRIPSEQMAIHEQFTNKYLPVSHLCRTESELVEVIDDLQLDAVFLGSDALFKYRPQKELLKLKASQKTFPCEQFEGNPFFGSFLGKLKKRIPAAVYAVSSQDCKFNLMSRWEKKQFVSAFQNFSYISVRDEWTRQMVEFITGKNGVNVFPDPVFGFNMNVLEEVVHQKSSIIEKFGLEHDYVLLSFSGRFADETYVHSLAMELKKCGLQPVALPMPELLYDCEIEKCIDLPLDPLDWYALIAQSCGFIGERMHPIVVSLHNSVPFFCFDEYGLHRKKYFARKKFWIPKDYVDWRTSKTYHIIKKAGLLDNWYSYSNSLMPDPTEVVRRLIGFDSEKCRLFSEQCYNEYRRGMASVMNIFNESILK